MHTTLPQSFPGVNGHSIPTAIPQGPARLPEAPCSMNGFVKIGKADTRSHQVTGRGATPAEAAANYFGCLDALEAGYAARAARQAPLASRTQRLSLLLACGLEKAQANDDTQRVERLLKAASLVLADCVSQAPDGCYDVRSQTEPSKTVYRVAARACTCLDAMRHAERHAEESSFWCKHSLAVLFAVKLLLQEQDCATASEGR